jgi:hypothetical protein
MVEEYFEKVPKINGKTVIELENRIKTDVKVSKGQVTKVSD